jgi:hypothetical protein
LAAYSGRGPEHTYTNPTNTTGGEPAIPNLDGLALQAKVGTRVVNHALHKSAGLLQADWLQVFDCGFDVGRGAHGRVVCKLAGAHCFGTFTDNRARRKTPVMVSPVASAMVCTCLYRPGLTLKDKRRAWPTAFFLGAAFRFGLSSVSIFEP